VCSTLFSPIEVKEIVITDSIPSPQAGLLPNLTVLSVSELIAGTISHIHDGRTISELFW
jgi:ribose-phosphate pyrophosphokinase